MKGPKATAAWYDWGCCANCQIYFLDQRPLKQKAWKEGWRPTQEEVVQMQEHMGLI